MSGRRERDLRVAAIKFAAFALVATVVTLTVAATIRPFGSGSVAGYSAIFSNGSRLKPGDDVRAAGVAVGRVTGVELMPDNTVKVGFNLSRPVPLTDGSRVEIRYLDLIGDRALALVRGPGAPLRNGATIPVSRTKPALDLNELFNGFKPLFAALSPNDVNALSMDIIHTLQGEGSTLDSLMQHTASLTNGLAQRDHVIGQVITNLNTVLGTTADRQGQLDLLIRELTRFVRGTADDRSTIGTAISQISDLTSQTAAMVADARPGIKADLSQLDQFATMLNQPTNHAELEDLLTGLGPKFAAIARTASNGSFFNYYACDIGLRISGSPSGPASPLTTILNALAAMGRINLADPAARCQS